MNLKEIQERHGIIEDQLEVWGGNPEPEDGAEAHEDRKELIRRVKKLEAQLECDKALIKDIAGCCSIRSVTHLLDRYYKSIGLNHYPGPANIRKALTEGGE